MFFMSIKSIKRIKSIKSIKRQTSDFLSQNMKSQNVKQVTFFLLDVFYEHKKNKTNCQTSEQVTFFLIDVLYEYKKYETLNK